MKHIQLFEDFKEGKMDKPKGFLSRIIQGAKHSMGMESKEDRNSLESIYKALSMPQYGFVTNVREIKPGVIVAYVNDNSVTVDKNVPEILHKGKNLDLHNLEEEADNLYRQLLQSSK